jgi:hypothetical protein
MTLIQSIPRSLKHPLKNMLVGVALAILGQQVVAETVAIPLGQQGKAWNVETPGLGLSKEQVRAQFGEPLEERGPIGQPPIYTWDYGQFSVYFEGNSVIHSVVKFESKSE